MSDLSLQMQLNIYENKHLPISHPKARQVQRVTSRIIESNLDIPEFREKQWATIVIDDPDNENAMVAGDGKAGILILLMVIS